MSDEERYEYLVLQPDAADVHELRRFLDRQGQNGWILASMQSGQGDSGITYLTVFYRKLAATV